MEILSVVVCLIGILYGLILLQLAYSFRFTSVKSNDKSLQRFVVVVPFRNESAQLPMLIDSLEKQLYPKECFRVLLVDDESDDNYTIEESALDIQIIKRRYWDGSPKKDALRTAFSILEPSDWVVTTDADCVLPPTWLHGLNSYLHEHPSKRMVCMPVNFIKEDGLLAKLQRIEMNALQVVTYGAFNLKRGFMCNGANFSYRLDFFESLGGFNEFLNDASGDDVYLLQKALDESSNSVGAYCSKDVEVLTSSAISWTQLINQRIRWASKTPNYKRLYPKMIAFVIMLMNLMTVIAMASLLYPTSMLHFACVGGMFFVKVLVDYYVQQRYDATQALNIQFLILCIIYSFSSTLIGIKVLFTKKYRWKGRAYKR